jgi:hypothetical protein
VNAPTIAPPPTVPVVPVVPPPPPPPGALAVPVFVAATAAGPTTVVQVTYSDGWNYVWTPFGYSFTGGAVVARGDVNRDGIDDIIVASGPGMPARVKVFDGATRVQIRSHLAFGTFGGGLSLAVGDVNRDGAADIVVGVAGGGHSLVKVIDGATGTTLRQFQAYGSGYLGGVRLAAGDVNNDGMADVVVAPAEGGRAIRVYNGARIRPAGQLRLLGGLSALLPPHRSGGSVAVGDITGDGYADIVVGLGAGHSKFAVYSGSSVTPGNNPAPVFTHDAWPNDGRNVRVSFAGDVDGDGRPDLIVSSVVGGKTLRFPTTQLTAMGWPDGAGEWFDPMPGTTGGVYVG